MHLEGLERVAPTATVDELDVTDAQRLLLRGVTGERVGAVVLVGEPVLTHAAAEALANRFGRELYRIDLAAVVSKYIGETEQNLRRVFDAAEEGGALLLFEEADALFGKRSEVKDSHDRYANLDSSWLVDRIEAYTGIVILTTNRPPEADAPLLRHVRHVIPLDLDGPIAAPEHHRILFQNDRVRVVETNVPVGETTALHTHLAPSAVYVVSASDFVRRDPQGQVLLDTRIPPFEWPEAMWSESVPAHTMENVGDATLIVISVELQEPAGR